MAGAVAGLVVGAAAAMAPFAAVRLAVITPFIPMYEMTEILVEGLTAFLLAVQFRATRRAYLGGLAGAYVLVMVTAVIQLLIFPGVFAKDGLLGAGPQSAVWLWVVWHAGFALAVALALLTRTGPANRVKREAMARAGWVLMAGAPLAGLVLAWLVIRHSAMLPMLIAQGAYSFLREGLTGRIVIGSILVAAALCVWITRLRDLVSLWVAVALLASLGDCLLVLLAGQRYSLGWYGGRLLSVVSSSVVLCALVYEFTWAYQRLLDANHELAHRVMHDGLTGAFNRVYFGEQFPRELRRAVRERAPMSVVMIDVDHFKTFNDACGHAAGDRCLIEVAAALQGAMRRPGDFVARYGGEEFVAVLPRTGAAGAMVTAEAMRHAVTRLGVSRGDGGGEVVTVSLGLATVDPAVEAVGPEVLVQRADRALYQAKRAGRNRVVAFAVTGRLEAAVL
jgi:diguanylate cyclase (GGDEF)-like protein